MTTMTTKDQVTTYHVDCIFGAASDQRLAYQTVPMSSDPETEEDARVVAASALRGNREISVCRIWSRTTGERASRIVAELTLSEV